MIEASAVTARVHARQLRWLLERCREADVDKKAVDEIQQMILEVEHLAGRREVHRTEDGCSVCSGDRTGESQRWTRFVPGLWWLRIEQAWQLMHVADEALIAIAPDWMVRARALEISVQAKRWLGPDDPRLATATGLAADDLAIVSQATRYQLAGLLHAVHFTWDRSYARAHAFKHLIVWACTLLTAAVAALVIVGTVAPGALPMCTASKQIVECATGPHPPSGGDVALVALIGAVAAGFSAVATVSRLRSLVDPYGTPFWQGLLKVPTGAFTALLGVLAIEQGLQAAAGLPASQGGILVLAFVFGYSQQLATRVVDSYGATIRAGLAGQRTRAGTAGHEAVQLA